MLAKYGRASEYSTKSKNRTAFKLEAVDFMAIFVFQKENYKGKALKLLMNSGKEEIIYGNNVEDSNKLEKIFDKWVKMNEDK